MQKIITLLLGLIISANTFGQEWIKRGPDIDGAIGTSENLGVSIDMTPNGNTMIVGVPSAGFSKGAARIYDWSGSSWVQRGGDLLGTEDGAQFGVSVSIDTSGDIIAVSAPSDSGDFYAFARAGIVNIYAWNGVTWIQRGDTLKGMSPEESFGEAVSLSANGSLVAVGAPFSPGGGTDKGNVRVFQWNDPDWTPYGDTMNGEEDASSFGAKISFSESGNRLAVGADFYDGGNGFASGKTYVYEYSAGTWMRQLVDSGSTEDQFGASVSISSDGNTLAVGAPRDFGGGIGYVNVYEWGGSNWTPKGGSIVSPVSNDAFGRSISLSGEGDFIAIGATAPVPGNDSGRVTVYEWNTSSWEKRGDSITGASNFDDFGFAVALSDSGKYLAASSPTHSMGDGHIRAFFFGTCNTSSSLSETACDSYTWAQNSQTYTTSGTHHDTLFGANALGCDSVVTLDLTIKNSTTSSIAPVACNTYTSPSGKIKTVSELFNDTIPNAALCDSVITIDLTIDGVTTQNISPSACETYTSPSGKVKTVSELFNDTLRYALSSCDSIVYSIDLTINQPSTGNISPSACESYTSPSGKIKTASETFNDTIPNTNGCDSIITINLTIYEPVYDTLADTACESYTWAQNNMNYTSSGTYYDTSFNAIGGVCDSIYQLELVINSSPNDGIIDPASTEFCDSDSLLLLASGGGSSNTYDWSIKGGEWDTVGNAGFSKASAGFTDLIVKNGIPYLAFAEGVSGGSQTTVMKYEAGIWDTVGNARFSSLQTAFQRLFIDDNDTIYVSYKDNINGGATMMKFNGASWVHVGTPAFSPGDVGSQSMYVLGGVPYLAFQDHQNGYGITVMKYESGMWSVVGTTSFSGGGANHINLDFNGTVPYVAFQDNANSGGATVMKYEGGTWDSVGNRGFSPGYSIDHSLAIDNGTPYVAFHDAANGGKATVMKYEGGVWDSVGNTGFSKGVVGYLSLVVENGVPYVAYKDNLEGDKVVVMKYEGGIWTVVGTAGFSEGSTESISLDSENGKLYVGYKDNANGGKATVMSLETATESASDSLFVYKSGIYYVDITNNGCTTRDSIEVTELETSFSGITVTRCEAYTSPSGNYIWDSTDIYTDTIANAAGCDSVITIDLTINPATDTMFADTADFVYNSPSGQEWYTSGTYMDTIINSVGCDSVITIDLHIKGTTILIDTFDCASYTSPTGAYTWTEDGVYGDTIDNPGDNDTLYLVTLDILRTYHIVPEVACDSFSLPSGKVVYTSGTYYDTLSVTNHHGCDSIWVITLNISSAEKTSAFNFSEFSGNNFKPLGFQAATVADINNDDKPDILYTGTIYADDEQYPFHIYQNAGDGNFTELTGTGLTGFYEGSITVGDIDNDNFADILVAGYEGYDYVTGKGNGSEETRLYKNNGNGTFSVMASAIFPAVSEGSGATAIADVDDDNLADILISCRVYESNSSNWRVTKLYKNNGDGTFTEFPGLTLDSIAHGDVAIADIDADNKPDIMMLGSNNSFQAVTKLYKNNGGGSFTDITPASFLDFYTGTIVVQDVNADNKPDILFVGSTSSGNEIKLYRNDGGGSFTPFPQFDISLDFSANGYKPIAAISDLDGDNLPDILITVYDYSKGRSEIKLYKNYGGGVFEQSDVPGWDAIARSPLLVSDVNDDNKPDIISFQFHSNGYQGSYYGLNAPVIYENKSRLFTSSCMSLTACNEFTSPSGKYTWTTSGDYRDTVTAPGGHDSIITVNLIIDSLTADFTIDYNPPAGEDVGAIIVNKAKGNNKTYLWDFGDGNTSTLKLPEHTYASTGSYELCLIVSNTNCTDTFCATLNITGKTNGPLSIKTIDQTEGSDDPSVGIKESPSAGGQTLSFNLFPNPTTDALNIINNNQGQFDVIVRDLSGREVMNIYAQENNTSLDLSILKSGLYMIEVWSAGKKGYYKVMKD